MSQKKLKINKSNLMHGLVLLILLSSVGPFFISPHTQEGNLFYIVMAVLTGFMFPWVQVVDVEEDKP